MSDSLRAKQIFLKAIELPDAARRAAFAAKACAADAKLLAAVERLLSAWTAGQGFLEQPAVVGASTVDASQATAEAEVTEGVGSFIGPYKLLEKIGEGGMGVVYMAEQERPVRRRVALKVIKLGMDTRQVVARFEAERQALALMDHPNIARVLEAGATAAGRPYFVMELVRGSPITDYCDRHKLRTRERLGLFVATCQAVQHAHHKGVIHRDLKPSNILVTLGADGRPTPKVIDFGIAKAIHQRLTDKTLFTEHRQLIGTPQYMSPEQAEADAVDVDTRTDVYALGVLLYELLTGTTPIEAHELARLAVERMQQVIREREPPRPSTRLGTMGATAGTVAALRGVQPAELSRILRGELDWVVMKALEKDRTRRYDTPVGLARDIERHLANEPVEACPPSKIYRVRKLFLKHRKLLATASAFAALLISGTAVSIGYAIKATRASDLAITRELDARKAEAAARLAREAEAKAKQEAEQRAATAEEAQADTRAFAHFFSKHILAASRSEGLLGGAGADVTLSEAILRAEAAIPRAFEGRPVAEAVTRYEIGVTLKDLGHFEKAEDHLRRALKIHGELCGPACDHTLRARHDLATTLMQMRRFEEALALEEENLRWLEETQPSNRRSIATTRAVIGFSYHGLPEKENKEKGLALIGEALELAKQLPADPLNPAAEEIGSALAMALRDDGRLDEAERLYQETIGGLESLLGKDHSRTLFARCALAQLHFFRQKFAEAAKLFDETGPELTRQVGLGHPDVLELKLHQATAYIALGRPGDAANALEPVFSALEARLGEKHSFTLSASGILAKAYVQLDRPGEALQLVEKRAALAREALGDRSELTIGLRHAVAEAYSLLGRREEAARIYEELLALLEDPGSGLSPLRPMIAFELSCELGVIGRGREAEERARWALERFESTEPRDELSILKARHSLATALMIQGKDAQAAAQLEELAPALDKAFGPASSESLTLRNNLASLLPGLGKNEEAVRLRKESLDAGERQLGRDHPATIQCRGHLANLYWELGNLDQAERLCEENLALSEASVGPDHALTFEARTLRSILHQERGEWRQAEALDRRNLERGKSLFEAGQANRLHVLANLGFDLLRQQRYEEAETVLAECVAGRREKEPELWTTFNAISSLGEALLGQGKVKEAGPLLLEGYRGLKKHAMRSARRYTPCLCDAIERIAKLFEARGKPAEAARWREELAREKTQATPPARREAP